MYYKQKVYLIRNAYLKLIFNKKILILISNKN